ncbi:unnamed protein product [Blumeria hordei]|uniref:AB hydrolase-1 domain-containing protein n=1 Tax=Blumeria hordei TaxID=2867405 RepID=A0A383UWJ6_BLUHO|nr:unnamed protein product [Blumeria hordei]
MVPNATQPETYRATASERRLSMLGLSAATSINQVQMRSTSPEVISSLITSLSNIRTSQALDQSVPSPHDSPPSPHPKPVARGHHLSQTYGDTCSTIADFEIDYNLHQHSAMQREMWREHSIDDLAASPPVIKTGKSPSCHPVTLMPKVPPQNFSSLRNLFGSKSRPSSRPSSKDSDLIETRSIGNLSIEPGYVSSESRRGSTDTRGKRQRRLIYTNSKEKLCGQGQEQERKKCSNANSDNRSGWKRLSTTSSFMDQNAIGEDFEARFDWGTADLNVTIPKRESSLLNPKFSTQGSRRPSQIKTREVTTDPSVPHYDNHDGCANEVAGNETSSAAHNQYLETVDYLLTDHPSLLCKIQPKSSPSSPLSDTDQSLTNQVSPDMIVPELIPNIRKSRRSGNSNSSRQTRNSKVVAPETNIADERPSSADSIDHDVEEYVSSPRLSQKIRHPQTGRIISFSEVGDPEGFAVFCCVGMGLTRYITAFYDELALTLKLRLITPDRPGVGGSEPYANGTATPLSWPDDVYAICQALKITKFSILAHSAGAIYALATALRMPQHIRGRVHLLAPWIPPSQMSVIGGQVGMPPIHSLPTSQRILRALPTPLLKAANSSLMGVTRNSMTSSLPKQRRVKRRSIGRDSSGQPVRNSSSLGIERESVTRNSLGFLDATEMSFRNLNVTDLDSDAAILAAAANTLAVQERQNIYESRLTNAIWNLATQGANPAIDLLVCLERRHTIGFRYVDITRSVVIHHGSKDTRVPLENVRWMGKTMKRCDVRVLEGEGHSLMASASIMSSILTEIAMEWEDWMKVTNITAGHRGEGKPRSSREVTSAGVL